MSEYTPGQWEASANYVIVSAKPHKTLCEVKYPYPCGTTRQRFEAALGARANAQLIAAAPDLLAAAEEALSFIEDYFESVEDEPSGAGNALRAAIAKARGKEAE
ncbi:hypothetical protein [Rubinisphaera brasiliensis]|uniref:Uncharacterized protein n=1 Tax=Rubinisphaera brasiliensis (strain ATCC 49424 / DSM 5305 / JCM 21570 / IAM 15109 / NBRC 103401 / IFAM 1448) TaxID=756272 RepID=F0SNI2_RUBBR|nr:hypothetical protein [Rubinisphaera brasiliensis]ADY57816.1 hypothetical protein Plabr_0186 [Rubinisphaera brasiliensis DSM 5305]